MTVVLTRVEQSAASLAVEREHAKTGERSLCADARATFVNLGDDGKTCPVPPLLAETEEERKLAAEAAERREARRSA